MTLEYYLDSHSPEKLHMSDNFNSIKEADKIERLAINALNANEIDKGIEGARLSCELSTLKPQELRDALKVMDQRENLLNNRPSVDPIFDPNGNIKTVVFRQWHTRSYAFAVDSEKCETK